MDDGVVVEEDESVGGGVLCALVAGGGETCVGGVGDGGEAFGSVCGTVVDDDDFVDGVVAED